MDEGGVGFACRVKGETTMTARQGWKYPYPLGVAEAISRHAWIAGVVGLILVLSGPLRLAGAENLDSQRAPVDYFPAWFKQSFLDLRQDLAEARGAGKRGVMLLFSIRGCPYCKMLVERSLKDPEIGATLRRHFDVIHLDIHSEFDLKDYQGRAMTVRAFSAREGMSFSPAVAFYGLDGQPLLRMVGYQTPERFQATLSQVIGMSDRPGRPVGAGTGESPGTRTD
jgi:thioredoxin-related protein